jgi:hypothetical protein
MDKIFTYSPSFKDKSLSIFRAVNPSDHKALLRTICCNSKTGYIEDAGSFVRVARHAADDVAKHVIRFGWSLGVVS